MGVAKLGVDAASRNSIPRACCRTITGASVAAIPCGTDLRQMRIKIDPTRIDYRVPAQEVADFTHGCYGPARAKLFMQRPQLDEEQMHDVTWIGSRFFTDTAGYYDSYRASTPARGLALRQLPRCRACAGVQRRLPELPAIASRRKQRLRAGFLSRADVDHSVIRVIASLRQQ